MSFNSSTYGTVVWHPSTFIDCPAPPPPRASFPPRRGGRCASSSSTPGEGPQGTPSRPRRQPAVPTPRCSARCAGEGRGGESPEEGDDCGVNPHQALLVPILIAHTYLPPSLDTPPAGLSGSTPPPSNRLAEVGEGNCRGRPTAAAAVPRPRPWSPPAGGSRRRAGRPRHGPTGSPANRRR